jgi:hypothetical protein
VIRGGDSETGVGRGNGKIAGTLAGGEYQGRVRLTRDKGEGPLGPSPFGRPSFGRRAGHGGKQAQSSNNWRAIKLRQAKED